MDFSSVQLSDDQAEAYDAASDLLREAGIDVDGGTLAPRKGNSVGLMAVLGKAGSGKTMLLALLCKALDELGVETVSGDYESRSSSERRTLAILAPTNKAANVLRGQGVPATTIHRILYTPVYDPEYEKIAAWLAGEGERPDSTSLSSAALDRAANYFANHKSIPGALAAAGLKGSDFIKEWTRRDEPLDVGFVDEASMLDDRTFGDLKEIFPTLLLFGDPAQLPPVKSAKDTKESKESKRSGEMVFDRIGERGKKELSRVHRQKRGSPILDLAHALEDPELEYQAFERMVEEAARRDDRVIVAERVDADLMARSPVLVWRNATRIRLIQAFRTAHEAPKDDLVPGEPLVCDGIELPQRHRNKRIDLEARGLIKGAQAIYLGPGRGAGFRRLFVIGAEEPQMSVASIVKLEVPDEEEPVVPSAANMGAVFLHGASVTIHKAQGSQWPEVQVFAPDIWIASRTGRVEAGIPLWKRLAYVAVTRAEQRLRWVMKNRLARPTTPLTTGDLKRSAAPMNLVAETGEG